MLKTPKNRKESQTETRARLIEVGRKHFLHFGLGGAKAEKIAAEAGFTRGALYANFADKEDLFVAVIRSTLDAQLDHFQTILASGGTAEERFRRLRGALGDMVVAPEWMLLQAEFQANALRSPAIRAAYAEQLARRRADGAALLDQIATELHMTLAAPADEVAGVLGALIEGLAIRQNVSPALDAGQARGLAMLCFDRLVSAGS